MVTGRSRLIMSALGCLALLLPACGNGSGDPAADTPEASSQQPAPDVELPGRLMFSRFDESTHTFISTHIANADGTDETELTLPGPEGGGRWSHTGEEIAVMTILPDERVGTAIIAPDGTVERTLEIPDETLNLVCTVWSSDDSRLACEGWDDTDPSRGGIYSVSSSTGTDLQRLTKPPEGLIDIPGDYSPDAEQFLFKRAEEESAGPLLIMDSDGGKPKPLSESEFEDAGRFSPDGTSVLTSGGGAIVVIDLEGETLESVDGDGAFLFGPVWSPDGEWIAYSRATTGPFADIYISRPDGADQLQVTSTDANEIVVEWGP